MGQLGQFIVNHWALWLGLILILLLILINEIQSQKKRAKEVSPQQAVHFINRDDATVIDLRDLETYRKGHIINSVRASVEDFEQQSLDKYKDKPIILVCAKGLQSTALAAKLRAQGFTAPMILAGGISAWQNADLPLVKGK
ncbi:rhodanese domain-containing protein [Legionella quinlivanii]|uniref:Rhodanese domain-containing protein n=1 Tax=Legionella quinlivanii TaxID=45073 RepID=A0A0W0Y111_9GAMM|nr:rhodanese-like domain-containing protein [Legionella quinlivanii]KTD50292.1 rhodanese domain-containing protein [Legionella quinlivanii]MCW8449962.1 rhodanese-like domain-containing protein [Legionella quinlivanii]SEF44448.1 Rhodanese-related sulfurtransferase [Legionella quinlivanii DSM 21216]STY11892.1 Rhodanese sulfurtransferase like protein [Legionella quinlivanii]